MTNERRQDLILAAVVVSVVFHAAFMFFVKTKVMTRSFDEGVRRHRSEPMRAVKYTPVDDPVRIEKIKDIMAVKDAPPAVSGESLLPVTEQIPDDASSHFDGEVPVPVAPDADVVAVTESAPAVMEADPLDKAVEKISAPAEKIEYTLPQGKVLAAPASAGDTGFTAPAEFGVPDFQPRLGAPPAVSAPVQMIASEPVKTEAEAGKKAEFKPADEVYSEVDEKIVEREKEAVRELMDTADAEELEKFVNFQSLKAEDGGWTYFKIMISPRATLPVVPKDVVVLLDASGSIGLERLDSCCNAAKRILRTCFNSGDRFNLVAFRNRYTYAFRNWRECDADSFSQADRWLDKLTTFGRTDVFASIRSVLTLPRDPSRPLIALVVTDGDANSGVSETAQILSRFTDLNGGLISVYMYGVRGSANRELIDVLTHGNRGESFIHGGLKWRAGSGIESLSERFRDPVLSDLRVLFTAESRATAYPRLLKNIYRGGVVEMVGRVPKGVEKIAFSLKGLNGDKAYDGFFRVSLASSPVKQEIVAEWAKEEKIDGKLK